AEIAVMLFAVDAQEQFGKLLAIGDAGNAVENAAGNVAEAAGAGIDIGAAIGGPLHIGIFDAAMRPDHGVAVIDQLIAQSRRASEIMVELRIGMLAAIGPVGEGVVALEPVVIFHIAAAIGGGAAFEAGIEAAAEIHGD